VRLRLGIWLRLEAGVYALASYPGSFERQCWAAVLGQPEAGVAGFAAAHALGFKGFAPGRPEVVVPPTGNARSSLALVHRYESPALVKVGGLTVTSRAQTLFDIASRVGVDRLERTLDDELLSKRLAVAELEERLDAYTDTRRAGLRVMRPLIIDRQADGFMPPASELERRADRILRRLQGKPRVVREASFPWLDRGRGRVDRYLPDEGVILEFDGRRWHTRVTDFDRDRWRDAQAIAEGLAPLRFTYAHITTRPAEVLDVIERARRARARTRRAA
jgi:very-short-patch-repair endonuclease